MRHRRFPFPAALGTRLSLLGQHFQSNCLMQRSMGLHYAALAFNCPATACITKSHSAARRVDQLHMQ